MPAGRFYNHTRRHRRRSRAATSIARGWRRFKQKRKGGLVTRTALSNRRAIKNINRKIETKYVTKTSARSENNYTGQQLAISGVDCLGMPNQILGINSNNPNVPGTPNAAWNSNSLCMRPICVANGIGEQQRVGEDITMTWLNIKGFVSAYPSSLNGTNATTGVNWADRSQRQRMRIVVVLDTQPVPWKSNGTPGTYQPAQSPGYLYNLDFPILNYPALPVALGPKNREYLRGLDKAPFGAQGADTSQDPWSQSYFENNFVQSKNGNKTARFKVLKTLTLDLAQPSADYSTSSVPSRRNFSMTIKAPYRFHFSDNTSTTPDNQEILIFFASDTKYKSPTNATATDPIVCTPKLFCQCKLAFKDP